jgi:hypothetical protein
VSELEEALRPFATIADRAEKIGVGRGLQVTLVTVPVLLDTLRFARAALNREPKPMTSDELDWLAENRALELSWGVIDNDLSDCAWRVHRCSGGINDREWSLIAIGETPRAALAKARNELPSH